MSFVTDIFREILWAIAKVALWFADTCYHMIDSIVSLNIGNYKVLWDWWAGLIALVVLLVTFRAFTMTIKAMSSEEFREKINAGVIFFRMIPLSLAILFLPLGMQYLTSAGTIAIKQMPIILNSSEDFVPSTIMITASMGGTTEQNNDGGAIFYTLTDLEEGINKRAEGNSGEYKYFKDFAALFLALALGIASGAGMVMVAIQFAMRIISLGIKVLISPIPISSLIDPNDQSFGLWIKMVLSDIITNFVQFLSLLFVLSFCSSRMVTSLGFFASAIVFLGGVFLIQKGIPELAQLIGGDTSTGSVMQQLATFRQGTSGFGKPAMKGAEFVAGSALTAGAIAGVAGGKLTGMDKTFKSLTDGTGAFASTAGTASTNQGMDSGSNSVTGYSSGSEQGGFAGGGQSRPLRDNPAQSPRSESAGGSSRESTPVRAASLTKGLIKAGGASLYGASLQRVQQSTVGRKATAVSQAMKKGWDQVHRDAVSLSKTTEGTSSPTGANRQSFRDDSFSHGNKNQWESDNSNKSNSINEPSATSTMTRPQREPMTPKETAGLKETLNQEPKKSWKDN